MSSAIRWRCKVCGYVHTGEQAPESCPVCGAPASEFERVEEAPPRSPAKVEGARAEAWRCLNCNYVAKQSAAPAECPVCGLPAEQFAPEGGELLAEAAGGQDLHVLVVGAGIAGLSAVEAARASNASARITLLGREAHLPYYRMNLTRYLAGEVRFDELPIHPESWYSEQDIKLKLGAEVRAIDPEGHKVELADGSFLAYDKLILTAGAHPFMPPIPGAVRSCVSTLRTIADADCILAEARPKARSVVIGGGILGLEVAGALARQGCMVDVVEGFGYLLPRQLTSRAAALLAEKVVELGIRIHTGAQVEQVQGDERVRAVLLDSGDLLEADLVVVAAGVRPNSYLARRAGLKVKQGLIVDDRMTTSHPDIYAAGDLAEHAGALYGIWGPALFQGRIAGMNAAGESAEFGGIARSNMLKVLGVDMFSIGTIDGSDGSYLSFDHEADGNYTHLTFRDKNLKGAVLLGDTSMSARLKSAIESAEDFSSLLDGRPSAGEVVEFLKG